jgi:hypothetical protein
VDSINKHNLKSTHTKIAGIDVLTRIEGAGCSETPLAAAISADRGNIARLALARSFSHDEKDQNCDAINKVLDSCRHESSLSLVLPTANHNLRNLNTHHSNSELVDVAVVDWDPEFGDLHAVQSGEMEVWVLINGSWETIFESDTLSSHARRRLDDLSASTLESFDKAAFSSFFTDRDEWQSAPLGKFDKSITRSASAFGVQAVVICTPDLYASPDRFADLGLWWSAHHDGRETTTVVHGELAMLFAATLS